VIEDEIFTGSWRCFIFQRDGVAAFGQLQSRAGLGHGFAEHGAAGKRFPPWQPSVAVNWTIRQTEIVRNARFICIFYFSVSLICAKLGSTKDCL
jgi:hypothetical protein